MGASVLKLRPFEALFVNGVLIENGERQSKLHIRSRNASILRLRDAIKPEDADTPLRKAYYVAQLAVAGELPPAEARDILAPALAELYGPSAGEERADEAAAAERALADGDFFALMRLLGARLAAD